MIFGRYVAHIFGRYIFAWGPSLKWKDNCVHYTVLQHLVLFMCLDLQHRVSCTGDKRCLGGHRCICSITWDLEVKGQRMKWTEEIHHVCTGAWQRGKNEVNVCDWNIHFAQCEGINFDYLTPEHYHCRKRRERRLGFFKRGDRHVD